MTDLEAKIEEICGRFGIPHTPLSLGNALREMATFAREQALREAADECEAIRESEVSPHGDIACRTCAEAIRELERKAKEPR